MGGENVALPPPLSGFDQASVNAPVVANCTVNVFDVVTLNSAVDNAAYMSGIPLEAAVDLYRAERSDRLVHNSVAHGA